MNDYRINAVTAGTCFLVAMAASLVGAGMIEPILARPDFLEAIRANSLPMTAGIVLEFVNAIAVIGIAASLYPILRKGSEGVAAAYLGFRVVESVVCAAGAFVPLLLTAMSALPAAPDAASSGSLQVIGPVLLASRIQVTGVLVPLFFCLGAFLLYVRMFRARFLPPFIAVWGVIAVVLVSAANLLSLPLPMMFPLVLPIIANEIFLGVWLLVRGFNREAVNGVKQGA